MNSQVYTGSDGRDYVRRWNGESLRGCACCVFKDHKTHRCHFPIEFPTCTKRLPMQGERNWYPGGIYWALAVTDESEDL